MARTRALLAILLLLALSVACGSADGESAVGAPAVSATQTTAEEAESEEEPEPEPQRRRVEAEAPLRMKQGVPARFFLSFGPEELPPNLPGMPGSQGGGATIELPAGGVVSPRLTAEGPAQIVPVDDETISVDSVAPKRWIWEVTVPLTATLEQPRILLSPSLRYQQAGDGAPVEVVWPLRPFDIEVEVHPRSRVQSARLFAREVQSELTFFGFSLVGMIGSAVSFVRWLYPYLRRRERLPLDG